MNGKSSDGCVVRILWNDDRTQRWMKVAGSSHIKYTAKQKQQTLCAEQKEFHCGTAQRGEYRKTFQLQPQPHYT